MRKMTKIMFAFLLAALFLCGICADNITACAMTVQTSAGEWTVLQYEDHGVTLPLLHVEYTFAVPPGSTEELTDKQPAETVAMMKDRLASVGLTDYAVYWFGASGIAMDISVSDPAFLALEEEGSTTPAPGYPPEEAGTEEYVAAEADAEEAATDEVTAEVTLTDETAAEAETSEEETDTYHTGMRTIFEEMAAEGYVPYMTDTSGYGFARVASDGTTIGETGLYGEDAVRKILNLIAHTTALRFVDPEGYVFMREDMIESVECVRDDRMTFPNYVVICLTPEGTRIFAEATARNVGRYISVWLDNEQLINAVVQESVRDGVIMVSGNYTQKEAETLADKIQNGRYPLTLCQDYVDLIVAQKDETPETSGTEEVQETSEIIETPEGSWTCPSCGNVCDDTFCPWCGTKNPNLPVICPQCGAEYDAGSGYAFCKKCGAQLTGEYGEE